MLREAQVSLLVDVRSFPRSRANSAFDIENLPGVLADVQIGYRHCPALGGLRSRQPSVNDDVNALWRARSFHNYADYALSDAFAAALSELIELGRSQRLALMCAEAVWWRCHRRIIADYLLLNGHDVDHLMSPGHREHATPTPGAVMTSGGKVFYPSASGPDAGGNPSREG